VYYILSGNNASIYIFVLRSEDSGNWYTIELVPRQFKSVLNEILQSSPSLGSAGSDEEDIGSLLP
jgi:hypothetical protein